MAGWMNVNVLFITDAGCVICTSSLYRIIYFITVLCMKQREILLITASINKNTCIVQSFMIILQG